MSDPLTTPSPADGSLTDAAPLHVATPEDLHRVADRNERFVAILARGDDRDREAERRDRRAEANEADGLAHVPWIDRNWAGRDRDGAAADRADLIEILREGEPDGAAAGDSPDPSGRADRTERHELPVQMPRGLPVGD